MRKEYLLTIITNANTTSQLLPNHVLTNNNSNSNSNSSQSNTSNVVAQQQQQQHTILNNDTVSNNHRILQPNHQINSTSNITNGICNTDTNISLGMAPQHQQLHNQQLLQNNNNNNNKVKLKQTSCVNSLLGGHLW